MSAIRSYAVHLQEEAYRRSASWRSLTRVADRIEALQLEIAALEDRADEIVAQIEADDAGALCLLTIAESAALHVAAGDVLGRACEAARLAGYGDEEIGVVLGVHRTTVARRFGSATASMDNSR